MLISTPTISTYGGAAGVEVEIVYEDSDTPSLSLFVETSAEFGAFLCADPNAFLIACILPAWRAGERRVVIDDSVCPVLHQNLAAAVSIIDTWYPDRFGSPPIVEAKRGFKPHVPIASKALSLLSGGIDSLSTLRWNKLNIPDTHPLSIKAVICFSLGKNSAPSIERLREATDGRMSAVTKVAADSGVLPIPVLTNMWWLVNDGYFFDEVWHGAFLSGIAGVFSNAFCKAFLASGRTSLRPEGRWGSHQILDSLYSSAHFDIEHTLASLSRFEKTALVSTWPVGLNNIRVCQNVPTGPNCGTCGKCIETMLALEALGKLNQSQAFPVDELTSALLHTVDTYEMIRSEYQMAYYTQLIPKLKLRQRDDLIEIIRQFKVYGEKP